MRSDAVAARRCLVLGLVLAMGCGPARVLTRPEGNGGWDPQRRRDELSARATAAAVALDPEAPPPEPENVASPLSLTDALALATSGNRRIAEADREVDAAAARVRDTRGRLLPATTGSGRYTWYSSALRNAVALPAGLVPGATNPSFVIREQQSGRLNGATVVPLDVTGELRQTLTAAQAGYRGERARAWATTLAQQVGVIRAYFDLLEAGELRDVTEQTIALDRAQLANAQQPLRQRPAHQERAAGRAGGAAGRASSSSAARPRHRSGALGPERGDRRPVDAPTAVVDVAERPVAPVGGRRAAHGVRATTRSCSRWSRSSSGSRTPRPRSRAAACRASRAAAPSTTRARRSSSRRESAPASSASRGISAPTAAARRSSPRRASRPTATASPSSASCASSRAPCATRATPPTSASPRSTRRAPPSARRRRTCASASSSSTSAAPPARTSSTHRRLLAQQRATLATALLPGAHAARRAAGADGPAARRRWRSPRGEPPHEQAHSDRRRRPRRGRAARSGGCGREHGPVHYTGFVEGEERVHPQRGRRARARGAVRRGRRGAGRRRRRAPRRPATSPRRSRRSSARSRCSTPRSARRRSRSRSPTSTWQRDVSAARGRAARRRRPAAERAAAHASRASRSWSQTGASTAQLLDDARAARDQAASALDRAARACSGARRRRSAASRSRASQLEVAARSSASSRGAQLAELEVTRAKYAIRAPDVPTVVQTQFIWPGELAQPGTPIALGARSRRQVRADLRAGRRRRSRARRPQGRDRARQRARAPRARARSSFVADQANFTPEKIETRSDRLGQVYRAKVRILEDVERFQPGTEGNVYLVDDGTTAARGRERRR